MKWTLPALALLGLLPGCGRPAEFQTSAPPPKVVHANVLTVGNLSSNGSFEVTGTVRSMLNASLSSKILGRVDTINVRQGASIKPGQLLATIDGRDLDAAVSMAKANYQAAVTGMSSAKTSALMESLTSRSKILQARAQVEQARAGLSAAEAHRDLVVAGTRTQEVAQSHIGVVEAESSLRLARLELERTSKLVKDGALAQRELDLAQNRYDVAKGHYDGSVQAESIAREGSRSQEVRAAQDAVAQAKAVLSRAVSGLSEAEAGSMQIEVRQKAIEVASSQAQQAAAALESAKVALSNCQIIAPFGGRVSARKADPGTMASPGIPLLEVEGGEYRLEVVVPESLLSSIRKGQILHLTISAIKEHPTRGKVVEIAPQADSSSHSFIAKLSLGNIPGLKSGMFGKVFLPTAAVKRILIPAKATWVREGLNYVYALNSEGIARLRIITLGETFGDKVEVLSGLSPSERIIIGDRTQVSDGVKVEGGAL